VACCAHFTTYCCFPTSQAFLSAFSAAQSNAAAQLDNLSSQQASSAAPEATDVTQQALDALAQAMLQQERSIADAAYYLPSFELKACTNQVQACTPAA
jgi:hypothetical protein